MRWIGKKTFLQYSLVTCCFSFHYFLPSLSVTSPFLQPLFPHTHISILSASPSVSFIPPSCLHLPVWLLRLRSVHHGLVLLCVFDSHLLSFLSLTGLTARPKLDWTVTHMATDENKPPVLGPLLKSQHHWITAVPPPPYGRTLAHVNARRHNSVRALSIVWLNNTRVLAASFPLPRLSIPWLCNWLVVSLLQGSKQHGIMI